MRSKWKLCALSLGSMVLGTTPAAAQTATAPPPQFDMVGFIQEATLDVSGAVCTPTDPALAGGTLTINGIRMIVPCNTVLQFPATSTTWAQVFDPAVSQPVSPISAPLPQAGAQTGLALADSPARFPSFEVRVVGNVLTDPVTLAQQYVVGLIAPVSQQALNSGVGAISYIDYATGAFRVGGIRNDPACVASQVGGGPLCSGALVQLNDPVGRFGLPHSPDPRFTADTNNPTIHATTGFPVCIPRGTQNGDPQCPQGNRPRNGDPRFPTDPFLPPRAHLTRFDMPAPVGAVGSQLPDARLQAPLEVGDWVTFSGTLFKIDPAGPNDRANTYVSVHTLDANLGIFTAPGVPPAYVTVEEMLIGTDGAPVAGLLQEATTRLTVVGFTTDPTQLVDIHAVDVNPCTGGETLRRLATVDPATQPVRGRFVERVLGGAFMPPTREYVVASRTPLAPNVANGLDAGQYRLPNFDFIFPENHDIGAPIVPSNFQDLPFLAHGSGPLFGQGPVVEQLDPWPGSPTPPAPICSPDGTAPLVSAGANFLVGSGAQVKLLGTATLDPNSFQPAVSWVQTAGPLVALAQANTLTPSFTAPTVPVGTSVARTFRLTVTDQFGADASLVTVTVTRPTDTVAFGATTWKAVAGGQKTGKLSVTATSSNPAVSLSLIELVTPGGTVAPLGTLTTAGNPAGTFTFSATGLAQPSSLILHSTGGGLATATCGAANATGVVTCQ